MALENPAVPVARDHLAVLEDLVGLVGPASLAVQLALGRPVVQVALVAPAALAESCRYRRFLIDQC